MDLSWGSPAQVSGGELAQRVRRFARSFKVLVQRKPIAMRSAVSIAESCRCHGTSCAVSSVPCCVISWVDIITEKYARYTQEFYEILTLTSSTDVTVVL